MLDLKQQASSLPAGSDAGSEAAGFLIATFLSSLDEALIVVM